MGNTLRFLMALRIRLFNAPMALVVYIISPLFYSAINLAASIQQYRHVNRWQTCLKPICIENRYSSSQAKQHDKNNDR